VYGEAGERVRKRAGHAQLCTEKTAGRKRQRQLGPTARSSASRGRAED
jgi:hypothetical protein